MQKNKSVKKLMATSNFIMVFIPIVLLGVMAYMTMASIAENAMNARLATTFNTNVLRFNYWKDYQKEKSVDEGRAELPEKLNLIKFKPSDAVFIKVDNVYKNFENPSESVDFSLMSSSDIYANSETLIKPYAGKYDIYISFQKSAYEGIIMLSDFRSDNSVYSNIFLKLIFVISLSAAVMFIIIFRKNDEPEERIRKALENAKRGDLKKGLINYEPGDEYCEIYEVYNDILVSEKKSIDVMALRAENLKKELESIEASVYSSEITLSGIVENKMHLETMDCHIEDIINTVVDIILTLDDKMNIVTVNRKLEDIVDMRSDEIIGKSIFDFFEFKNISINDKNIENKKKVFNIFLKKRVIKKISVRLKKDGKEFGHEYSTSIRQINLGYGKCGYRCICRIVDESGILDDMMSRHNYELNQMREINEKLSTGYNIEATTSEIIEKISDLTNANGVAIMLIEENRLVPYQSSRSNEGDDSNMSVFGNGLTEKIFKDKGVCLARNSDDLKRERHVLLDKLEKESRYINIIPIKHNEERIGIVTIDYDNLPEEFIGRTIYSLVGQIAIAIYKIKLYEKQKLEYMNTIKALVATVEAKDEYTHGHSERVSEFSKMLAAEMGMDETFIDEIEISGILHDIGKIGISDEILMKPGKLSIEEFDHIKKHPEFGYKIVEPIGLSKTIVDGILFHHLRYDKTGYPGGECVKDDISIAPAIMGVADAFDAITSKRSYSEEKPIYDAVVELERCSGDQFDPEVVSAFRRIYDTKVHIIEEICRKKSTWNCIQDNSE